jgi:type II secretory ATPase GspE/PulE/Tfp pilus assembly ATPase PilB-like protein
VLGVEAQVHRMVMDGLDADAIRRPAASAGMMSLRRAGFRRVVRGDTTLEAVMAVVGDEE